MPLCNRCRSKANGGYDKTEPTGLDDGETCDRCRVNADGSYDAPPTDNNPERGDVSVRPDDADEDPDEVSVPVDALAELFDTNQSRVYMRTSAANGFDGNEVEVEVQGTEGETAAELEAVAERRFEQAVDSTGCDDSNPREYQ